MSGDRIVIECTCLGDTFEGESPKLTVTGNMEKVMGESIEIAHSFAKSFLDTLPEVMDCNKNDDDKDGLRSEPNVSLL